MKHYSISIEQHTSGSWVWEVSSSEWPTWLMQVGVSESLEGALAEVAEALVLEEQE